MKKLKFHIVGLTHNDVKGREVEYAREAEGRTICLVPDDANPFDMLAVKAYDKQLFIGYVSALEGEDVRALIIARKGRNLRTRCLGSNSKEGADEKSGLQLIVEARVDVSEQEIEQARRESDLHERSGEISHDLSFFFIAVKIIFYIGIAVVKGRAAHISLEEIPVGVPFKLNLDHKLFKRHSVGQA